MVTFVPISKNDYNTLCAEIRTFSKILYRDPRVPKIKTFLETNCASCSDQPNCLWNKFWTLYRDIIVLNPSKQWDKYCELTCELMLHLSVHLDEYTDKCNMLISAYSANQTYCQQLENSVTPFSDEARQVSKMTRFHAAEFCRMQIALDRKAKLLNHMHAQVKNAFDFIMRMQLLSI